MIVAPLPSNERERLEALKNLHLLDTPLEERFERITRLACRILDVPIASFILIDGDRQWAKSIQGLNLSETSRDIAFCTHTILQNDVMLVENTTQDERFQGNPLVIDEPKISFYAGCPVHGPNGEKIGTICALDTKPRIFDQEQIQVIRDLAQLVETELRANALTTTQALLIQELDTSLRLAMIDQLTRLWNPRGIREMLAREWNEALRENRNIALAMVQVDNMEAYKINYGNAGADKIIKTVSSRILTALRLEDTIGRLEEDSFLLILRHCNSSELHLTVERIRVQAMAAPINIDGVKQNITLSTGATMRLADVKSGPEAYIKMAEDALALAKSNGSNRTEISMPIYL